MAEKKQIEEKVEIPNISGVDWKDSLPQGSRDSLDVFEGKSVIIQGFREESGQWGKYLVCDVREGESLPIVQVNCGSKMVMAKLIHLRGINLLPVRVYVRRKGRRLDIE